MQPPADPLRTVLRSTRELEQQLSRERGRSRGLERGLSSLAARVAELRRENEALRARLDRRAPSS